MKKSMFRPSILEMPTSNIYNKRLHSYITDIYCIIKLHFPFYWLRVILNHHQESHCIIKHKWDIFISVVKEDHFMYSHKWHRFIIRKILIYNGETRININQGLCPCREQSHLSKGWVNQPNWFRLITHKPRPLKGGYAHKHKTHRRWTLLYTHFMHTDWN